MVVSAKLDDETKERVKRLAAARKWAPHDLMREAIYLALGQHLPAENAVPFWSSDIRRWRAIVEARLIGAT